MLDIVPELTLFSFIFGLSLLFGSGNFSSCLRAWRCLPRPRGASGQPIGNILPLLLCFECFHLIPSWRLPLSAEITLQEGVRSPVPLEALQHGDHVMPHRGRAAAHRVS